MTEVFPASAWAGFGLAFAAFWALLFHVIARVGGWSALAETYPERATPVGERFRMRSLQLRVGCNYNGCVTLVASPSGLHLSMPLFFRFGHAPIELPWTELRASRSRSWLMPVIVLTPLRRPEVPVKLSRRFGERLLAAAGAPIPVDSPAPGEPG